MKIQAKALLAAACLLAAPGLHAGGAAASAKRVEGERGRPRADIWIAPTGVDSAGVRIGVDCVETQPCRTQAKAAAMLAANIAKTPNRSYVIMLRGGRYETYDSGTLVLNARHTPGPLSSSYTAPSYGVTWKAYPGETPVWSGGKDISGTFKKTVLPGGGPGCASDALAPYAPLVNDPARGRMSRFYAGFATVNGKFAPPVYAPRKTYGWNALPAPGEKTDLPVTATLAAGSSSIAVSDMSRVGLVGDPVSFGAGAPAALGGLAKGRLYYVVGRSAAASGAGVVEVANAPGGAAVQATESGRWFLLSGPWPTNFGDRLTALRNPERSNLFQINPGDISATPSPSGDVRDLKIEFGEGGSMVPIASKTGDRIVTESYVWRPYRQEKGAPYRIVNDYGRLGEKGFAGEVYTDRKTGRIYYSLRAGESCEGKDAGGLARKGAFVIPVLDNLIRVSNAAADAAANGARTGVLVGNQTFEGVTFSDTQVAAFSCDTGDASGNVCGAQQAASSQYFTYVPTIAGVGASNVHVDDGAFYAIGGSAIGFSWGSNHYGARGNRMEMIGGQAIMSGASLAAWASTAFSNDAGYVGAARTGPTTNALLRGDPETVCCGLFENNHIANAAFFGMNSSVATMSGGQRIVWRNNTIHYCVADCFAAQSRSIENLPENLGDESGTPIYKRGVFGDKLVFNDIGYAGYETDLSGGRGSVPNSTRMHDFGVVYVRGPHDGLGENPDDRFEIAYNLIHDMGCRPDTVDCMLSYLDGNNANGINYHHNLLYQKPSVNGVVQNLGSVAQHTGGLRSSFRNNIFSGIFPPGASYERSSYGLLGTTGAWDNWWREGRRFDASPKRPEYVIWDGRAYSTTMAGAAGATPPTCLSGSCSDGALTWTFAQALRDPRAVYESNIFVWTVLGSDRADPPERLGFLTRQMRPSGNNTFLRDRNVFFQAGPAAFSADYVARGDKVSVADWRAVYGNDVHGSFGVDPNFVDWTSGAPEGFDFKPTGDFPACGGTGGRSTACGLGFVPWDFSRAGAKLGAKGEASASP
ncbi:hypothetical protein [Methylocella sp.]|uniref:hypothetical protein n=1 Tax=Methylocella sp. TaxID=1978226 RepID=UPI003784B806